MGKVMMAMRSQLGAGLMLVTAIGCGGGGTGTETADGSETAGGEATQYDGPIASTDAERGAERFETFCGGCHPGGQEDVGPSLIAEPHSAGRIRQQIREGAAQMRPFSAGRLSDADMETILAYMATIGAVEGVAATAPAAPTTDAPAAE